MKTIDNLSEGMIGFYGVPGTQRATNTHVVVANTPICRYRPSKEYEFQWCSRRISGSVQIECAACRKLVQAAPTNLTT